MKKISILSLSIVMVTIFACLSCGWLISSAIVGFSSVAMTSSVKAEKQTLFAISLSKSQVVTETENAKADLQIQNGAGYVYKINDYYHLLASVYENKNDAELVKTNLSNSGVESEILTIEIAEQNVEGNFNSDEKTIITNCLNANLETYKKLYDVAISLDTNVFDKIKAKLECNKIYANLISIKTNFKTFFKNDDKNVENIAKNLEKTENLLSNLISENYDTSSQTFSSLIKLCYCQILLG